ncbi:hypothetical protein AB0J72_37180 [Dactylosporangium sp. NPDC049742]|uniref:hypothetical protein n=1 Tax=Dactylosporangium sp. NPDC049742 TaxID=3154737 RepID=UPI003445C7D1
MNRLWWWCGGVVGAVVLVTGYLIATDFPARSDALAARQPGTCGLLTAGANAPYGVVASCMMLGRRTPPGGDPDGTVFVVLETDRGPVALRVEYNGEGDAYTADAVEIPAYLAPGISGDLGNRIKDGINQRGGLRAEPWRVHG